MERGISQSALSLYRNCPYSYKLKYVDKCTPIFYDTVPMDVGGLVHDSIHLYYRDGYDTTLDSEDIFDITYSYMKNNWDLSFPIDDYKKAYDCLKTHANWEYNNVKKGLIIKPMSELKLSANGYYGIIDYVNLQNNTLIDWKTNKHSILSYEYRMQAEVYRELFEVNFKKSIDKFYFFFLFNNEWRIVDYSSSKQLQVRKELKQMLDDVHNKKFDKNPRLPSSCKNCAFSYYCKILKT